MSGLKCICGSRLAVIDSRHGADHVRRRRKCNTCSTRVTSVEVLLWPGQDVTVAQSSDHATGRGDISVVATDTDPWEWWSPPREWPSLHDAEGDRR